MASSLETQDTTSLVVVDAEAITLLSSEIPSILWPSSFYSVASPLTSYVSASHFLLLPLSTAIFESGSDPPTFSTFFVSIWGTCYSGRAGFLIAVDSSLRATGGVRFSNSLRAKTSACAVTDVDLFFLPVVVGTEGVHRFPSLYFKEWPGVTYHHKEKNQVKDTSFPSCLWPGLPFILDLSQNSVRLAAFFTHDLFIGH